MVVMFGLVTETESGSFQVHMKGAPRLNGVFPSLGSLVLSRRWVPVL